VQLDELRQTAEIMLERVTAQQAEGDCCVRRSFGKGRLSAGLNFGSCFAYALACIPGQSLLFKGDDFSQTNIELAR